MVVGFDLDGIFVQGPPFIPNKILEWLYRGPQHNGPTYRFPTTKIERLIRQISHFYFFRPPLQKNINFIREFQTLPNYPTLYLISSRYQFLERLTKKLLQKYDLLGPFSKIYLNTSNKQPHLFKKQIIKKCKIDLYIDDDLKLLEYLHLPCPHTRLLWYNPTRKSNQSSGITTIKELAEIEKYLYT